MAYAFRCNNCGHLEPAAHAGERDIPRACSICGQGTHPELVNGNVAYVDDADNWTVLADLSDKELEPILKHHGEIKIERHKPIHGPKPDREPQVITREVSETLATEDVPS